MNGIDAQGKLGIFRSGDEESHDILWEMYLFMFLNDSKLIAKLLYVLKKLPDFVNWTKASKSAGVLVSKQFNKN